MRKRLHRGREIKIRCRHREAGAGNYYSNPHRRYRRRGVWFSSVLKVSFSIFQRHRPPSVQQIVVTRSVSKAASTFSNKKGWSGEKCGLAGWSGSSTVAPTRDDRHGVGHRADERDEEQMDAGLTQVNPLRMAQTAACVRSETPILPRMCWTCSLTVS